MRKIYMGDEGQTEIEQAVADYLTEHPPEIEQWQMDTARQFIDSRIRMASKKIPAMIDRQNKKNFIIAAVIGGIVGAIVAGSGRR